MVHYMIYKNSNKEPTVGLSFDHAPDTTLEELNTLIDELTNIRRELMLPENWQHQFLGTKP